MDNKDNKTDFTERWKNYSKEDEELRITNNARESYDKSHEEKENPKLQGISFGGKPLYDAGKDSDTATIIKTFAVTGLCIAGFVVPLALKLERFGFGLCIFGAIALSIAILKNT